MRHANKSKVTAEQVASCLGTGSVVQIINEEFAGNPQAVVDVIHRLRTEPSLQSPTKRTLKVIEWCERALWHAWHNTIGTGLMGQVFPETKGEIKTDLIIRCMELGTKVARNQLLKVSNSCAKRASNGG